MEKQNAKQAKAATAMVTPVLEGAGGGLGNPTRERTKMLTKMAMLSALSIICILVVRIPLIPSAGWLEYDMADAPILLATFLLGPLAGLKVLAVVCLLQAFLLGGNNLFGFIMHFVATGAFIMVAYFVAMKLKGAKGMIIGLILGTLTMTAVMIPLNLLITPYLFMMEVSVVVGMLPAIVLFNLVKAGLNSIIFFIIYKVVSKVNPKLISNQAKF